jgi:hypothetical protein
MGEEKYKEDIVLRTEDGKIFEVPIEGSIGLLALGAAGLKAWRAVKINAKIDNQPPETLKENDEILEEE